MKFSLIIPFYNAGRWIGRCLDSCLRQDLPEDGYELILIDDGSTDNGRTLAEERLRGRNNVTFIINNENKGQGAARNRGLDIARGELIWFIDADDRIEENCLARVADLAACADILAISAADWKEGKAVRRFGWDGNGRLPAAGRELMCREKINVGTPFSIYRKSLLDTYDLRFMEGIFHEDAEFAPRAYYYAGKVVCTDRIFYYVYPSPGSTTRSANPKRVFDSIESAQRSLSDFSFGVSPLYRSGFDNLISSDMTHALKDASSFDRKTRRSISGCVYRNRDLFRHMRRSTIPKFRLEGLIFTIFPRMAVGIMKTFLNFALRSRAERIKV